VYADLITLSQHMTTTFLDTTQLVTVALWQRNAKIYARLMIPPSFNQSVSNNQSCDQPDLPQLLPSL
jgi:hypothetical protein